MAACAVRDIETVKVYSPNKENREAFCREYGARMNVEIIPVESGEAAMEGMDIAMCSSSSLDYIFDKSWIAPGMHFAALKSQRYRRMRF